MARKKKIVKKYTTIQPSLTLSTHEEIEARRLNNPLKQQLSNAISNITNPDDINRFIELALKRKEVLNKKVDKRTKAYKKLKKVNNTKDKKTEYLNIIEAFDSKIKDVITKTKNKKYNYTYEVKVYKAITPSHDELELNDDGKISNYEKVKKQKIRDFLNANYTKKIVKQQKKKKKDDNKLQQRYLLHPIGKKINPDNDTYYPIADFGRIELNTSKSLEIYHFEKPELAPHFLTWDSFLNNLVNNDEIKEIIKAIDSRRLRDYGDIIVFTKEQLVLKEKIKKTLDFDSMKKKRKRDSIVCNTISSKYINRIVNKEATKPEDLFLSNIVKNGNGMCGVDICMCISKKWNELHTLKKIDVEIIKQELREIALYYNLSIDERNGDFAITDELMGHWFRRHKSYLHILDIHNVVIYPRTPKDIKDWRNMPNNNHYPSIYVISHNSHYYHVNDSDRINAISKKLKNEHKGINQPKDYYPTYTHPQAEKTEEEPDEKTEEPIEKKQVVKVFHNVEDILSLIIQADLNQENTKAFYTGDIIDVFEYLMIACRDTPIAEGSILRPSSCYIHVGDSDNKIKIHFSSIDGFQRDMTTVDNTLINLTPEALEQYYEDKLNIRQKLLCSKNISDYSDDLKSLFSITPTPLKFAVNNNKIKNASASSGLCGLDFNKSYSYILTIIKNFGKFTFFDTLNEYNNEDIEDCNIYICKFSCDVEQLTTADKLISSIRGENKNTFLTFGFLIPELLNIKSLTDFNILQFLKPYSIVENPIRNDINDLFNGNKLYPSVLQKSIGNETAGLCAKGISTNKKALISLDIDDMIFQRQEIQKNDDKAEFSGIKKFGAIHYMCQTKSTELLNGYKPLSMMIYAQQRFQNLKLYDSLLKQNIKVLALNVDMLYFDYNSLSQQQKDFIKSIISTKIGGVKLEMNVKTPYFNFKPKQQLPNCDIITSVVNGIVCNHIICYDVFLDENDKDEDYIHDEIYD